MNQDTDLFVQAFWVKVREVIRPQIDAAVHVLRGAGNEASVSTQEYSAIADRLPAHVGPSLTLSVRPPRAPEGIAHPAIEFHGDVGRQAVEVRTSAGKTQSYELAALETREVKAELEDWTAKLTAASPA
jgi:hypothetical protein